MPSQTSNSGEAPIPFAQLWIEEQRDLAARAATIPPGGTIVEIGCAQGGSATILDRAAPIHQDTRIFSIDPSPAPLAKERLRNTRVEIIEQTSAAVAAAWTSRNRTSIDLLLIDGDHSFRGIWSDFEDWRSHLSEASTIMFHDVDVPQRGGCAHLSIRVFIDTLIREKWLIDSSHHFRFVSGRVSRTTPRPLPIAPFLETLERIREEISSTITKYRDMPIEQSVMEISKEPLPCKSLDLCYLVGDLVEKNYHVLHDRATNAAEFRRWTEALWLLDHGCGGFVYPGRSLQLGSEDFNVLSEFLAREQVRVNLLRLVAQSLFTWQL